MLQEIAGEAEERYKKIKEKLHEMKTDGGKINSQKFQNLKKTMHNKHTEPPAAFLDSHGNLVTSDKAYNLEYWKSTQKG